MATSTTLAGFVAAFMCLPLACSEGLGSTETDAPSQAQGVAIASLVTHDAKVTLLGGGGGGELRVVIHSLDGALVADGLTLAELRAQDSDLYTVVTSAFAASAAPDESGNSSVTATAAKAATGRRTFVDATLGATN